MKSIKYIKIPIFLILIIFSSINFIYAGDSDLDKCFIKSTKTNKMEIAITFDDGPHPKETDKILDILDKYNAKATFFVVGKHVNWYSEPVIRASKEGHEIANHTFTHPNVGNLSEADIKKEIKDCEKVIIEKTGKKPKLFRPPFGSYDKKSMIDISKELGYSIVLWSSIDAKDWRNPPPNETTQKIISNISDGDIILLHDYGTKNTVLALDSILSELTKKGYKFVTVSQLIEDSKPEVTKKVQNKK